MKRGKWRWGSGVEDPWRTKAIEKVKGIEDLHRGSAFSLSALGLSSLRVPAAIFAFVYGRCHFEQQSIVVFMQKTKS